MGSFGETQGIAPCLARAQDDAQTLARITDLLARN